MSKTNLRKVSRRIPRKRSSPVSSKQLKLYRKVFMEVIEKKSKSRRKTRKPLTDYQKFVKKEFKKMKDSKLTPKEKMKQISSRWKH